MIAEDLATDLYKRSPTSKKLKKQTNNIRICTPLHDYRERRIPLIYLGRRLHDMNTA